NDLAFFVDGDFDDDRAGDPGGFGQRGIPGLYTPDGRALQNSAGLTDDLWNFILSAGGRWQRKDQQNERSTGSRQHSCDRAFHLNAYRFGDSTFLLKQNKSPSGRLAR